MKRWLASLFVLLAAAAPQARGYTPAETSCFLHPYDGLGSTRLLTTTNGAVANVFAYDAYGTLIESNGSPQTVYLYCGEQFDPQLGFYYLRARYLNTGTGRFWTRDTAEGFLSDPISLHRYLYAHADPVNRIDPSGHMSFAGTISVGGIWGGWAGVQLPAISGAKVWAMTKIGVTAVAIGVTLTGHERPQQQNAMRLQLQESTDTFWSLPLVAPPPVGVTSAHVYAGLKAMHDAVLSGLTDIEFPMRLEPELYSAIIRISQRIQPIVLAGGVTEQGKNVLREVFVDREKVYRIDLENIRGHNLRK